MYKNLLNKIGLSDQQASVYETLLQKNGLMASQIQRKTGISRPLTYRIIDQLVELGLIRKQDKVGAVTRFFAEHPYTLRKIVEDDTAKLKQTQVALDASFESLVSLYRTVSGEPGIFSLSGIEGIELLQKETLKSESEILLIRSIHDKNQKETRELIDKYMKKRADKGIVTKALTPTIVRSIDGTKNQEITKMIVKGVLEADKKYLVKRKFIDFNKFNPQAQITIYDERLAISTYQDPQITTFIDHQDITSTFHTVFRLLWESATLEHEAVMKKLEDTK